jgi:hypothetical protein
MQRILMNDLKTIIDEIHKNVLTPDFIEKCEDYAESLKRVADTKKSIAEILKIFETYPAVDFGNPGPLTHFIETHYKNGYETQLHVSLKRKPTPHTVWLLNRILNDSTHPNHDKFYSLMKNIAESDNVMPEAKQEAIDFLDT